MNQAECRLRDAGCDSMRGRQLTGRGLVGHAPGLCWQQKEATNVDDRAWQRDDGPRKKLAVDLDSPEERVAAGSGT